jgi:hypothetical protein
VAFWEHVFIVFFPSILAQSSILSPVGRRTISNYKSDYNISLGESSSLLPIAFAIKSEPLP